MTRMPISTSRQFITLARQVEFVLQVAMESTKQLSHNMVRHGTMLHAGNVLTEKKPHVSLDLCGSR